MKAAPTLTELCELILQKGEGRKDPDPEVASQVSQLLPYPQWFNDEVIDRYFDVLSHEFTTSLKKISYIPSGRKEAYLKDIGAAGRYQIDRKRLQAADVILCPRSSGDHWYLVIIQKQTNNQFTLYVLDGFNGSHGCYFNYGKNVINALYGQQADITINTKSILIQRQTDIYNCGPVICQHAKMFCEEVGTNSIKVNRSNIKCDYTQFRYEVAETLAALEPDIFFRRRIQDGKITRKIKSDPTVFNFLSILALSAIFLYFGTLLYFAPYLAKFGLEYLVSNIIFKLSASLGLGVLSFNVVNTIINRSINYFNPPIIIKNNTKKEEDVIEISEDEDKSEHEQKKKLENLLNQKDENITDFTNLNPPQKTVITSNKNVQEVIDLTFDNDEKCNDVKQQVSNFNY